MKAGILCIGTEIVQGEIHNTNAKEMSVRLESVGMEVSHHMAVSDELSDIMAALGFLQTHCEWIFCSGGLGPTVDDRTKEAVAKFLGVPLLLDRASQEKLEQRFGQDSEAVRENLKQAMFPKGAKRLENHWGTADACMISGEHQRIVLLPGPPGELLPLMDTSVLPILESEAGGRFYTKTIRVKNIGEWKMNQKTQEIMETSSPVTVAPYATNNGLILRCRVFSKEAQDAEQQLNQVEQRIRETLLSDVIGSDDGDLTNAVCHLLKQRNITIATAESITGGMVASTLVESPGISEVFQYGYVVYSDHAKREILGVKSETLDAFSAVSKECCLEMLLGLEAKTRADCLVATTGYAGPEGREVGRCIIGIRLFGQTHIIERSLRGDRNAIRKRVRGEVFKELYQRLHALEETDDRT